MGLKTRHLVIRESFKPNGRSEGERVIDELDNPVDASEVMQMYYEQALINLPERGKEITDHWCRGFSASIVLADGGRINFKCPAIDEKEV